MSENRQAQSLARWLDSSPGDAPPADLAEDVVQAVLALRPDRAPAPRVGVLDILDAVQEGPLASPDALPDPLEERAAARFAELLDEGATDEDDPALEALFALRPDLAPPPRVSVFEIMGSVRAGPLAEPVLDDTMPTLPPGTGELPVALEAANTVPPEAGVKPPRRRFWVWLWPGPLALAAAALTLFMVLPAARDLPTGFPAAEQAPIAMSGAERSAAIPEAAPADAPDRPSPELAAAGTEEQARLKDAAPATTTAAPDELVQAPAEAPAGDDAPARETRGADGEGYGWGALPEEPANQDMVAGGAPAAATAAPKASMDTLAAAPPAATGGAATGPTLTLAKPSSRSIVGRGSASSAPAPAAAPAAPRQSIAEMEMDEADGLASSGSEAEAISLEAARKRDGRRDSAERRQDREESAKEEESPDRHQLARANRALALGDMATAEVRLRPLLTSQDREVVVEASLRLCRIFLAQGRTDEVRATVAIGLAAGPEPARLYAELQQISAAVGP